MCLPVLLSAKKGSLAFTYADLYAMLCNRKMIAWLTPYAAIVSGYGRAHGVITICGYSYSFRLIVNGKHIRSCLVFFTPPLRRFQISLMLSVAYYRLMSGG
jgi:hypothetical protein